MADTDRTPIDWALRPLKKYADFTGRAPRAEYWWYVLALVIIAIVISIVENILGINQMFWLYGPFSVLLLVGTLIPSLAVMARRLHDSNRSGWWMMIVIVPEFIVGLMTGMAMAGGGSAGMLGLAGILGLIVIVGAIALLVFLVLPGTPGENRFGPNPHGIQPEPATVG